MRLELKFIGIRSSDGTENYVSDIDFSW